VCCSSDIWSNSSCSSKRIKRTSTFGYKSPRVTVNATSSVVSIMRRLVEGLALGKITLSKETRKEWKGRGYVNTIQAAIKRRATIASAPMPNEAKI